MDVVTETITAELRAQRAKKQVSRRELAEVIESSPSTIRAWESRGGIGLKDAWQLADYYGVSLDELAGRKFDHREVTAHETPLRHETCL